MHFLPTTTDQCPNSVFGYLEECACNGFDSVEQQNLCFGPAVPFLVFFMIFRSFLAWYRRVRRSHQEDRQGLYHVRTDLTLF